MHIEVISLVVATKAFSMGIVEKDSYMNILDIDDKVSISRRDLYCLAKSIQGLENGGAAVCGCAFCKIDCRKPKSSLVENFNNIKQDLQEITGVSSCVLPEQRIIAFSGDDPETFFVQ